MRPHSSKLYKAAQYRKSSVEEIHKYAKWHGWKRRKITQRIEARKIWLDCRDCTNQCIRNYGKSCLWVSETGRIEAYETNGLWLLICET